MFWWEVDMATYASYLCEILGGACPLPSSLNDLIVIYMFAEHVDGDYGLFAELDEVRRLAWRYEDTSIPRPRTMLFFVVKVGRELQADLHSHWVHLYDQSYDDRHLGYDSEYDGKFEPFDDDEKYPREIPPDDHEPPHWCDYGPYDGIPECADHFGDYAGSQDLPSLQNDNW